MLKKSFNSNKKGITITSLTIYVIVATIVVGILVFLNANFFSNINDLTDKANIVGEYLDFKSAFIRDIKSENEVKVTDYNSNMIRLSNNVKYEIRVLDKNAAKKKYAIYRNDVQIAKNIVSHTEVGGQVVKEGPYFEYDVNTNTIKVGIKFSDGQNSYVESGTYVVGKALNPSWDLVMDDLSQFISGDIDTDKPEDSEDSGDNSNVPAEEKIYAVLYTDGTLQISNTKQIDSNKTVLKDFGETSVSVALADPDWLTQKAAINKITFTEPVILPTMENLFSGCLSLEKIDNMDYLDISNVTNASNAFKDCEKLTSISLKELDTSNLSNISGLFDGCESLTNIELNSVDFGNVENMSNVFKDCSSIQSIDLNGLSVSPENLTDVSNMFANCESLTNLNISNLDLTNVTNISRMFYNCQSISHIAVGSINSKEITNMSYLFYNCKKLNSVNFGYFDSSNVTDISYMFANCENYSGSSFPISNTSNVTNMEGLFLNCANMNQVNVSVLNTSNVTNMSRMFEGCSKLTSFNGLDSFDTQNVTNMSAMFKNCSSLSCNEQFKINNFNTALVRDFSSMFEGCTNFGNGNTSLNLKNFDTTNAQNMSKMFMNDINLKSILVSDSWNTDYSDVDITDMFENCGTTVLTKQ